jgi:hypothetical protein
MSRTLTADPEGRLHCGICGYAAMAIQGVAADGKLVAAEFRDGVPLFVICVFCRRYWEHCDRPCTTFAAQRPLRTHPKENP